MIQVSLNGEIKTLTANNLLQAMAEWQYILEQSAVAINGEFISRSRYTDIELHDGDEIDVVAAVGGG